MYSLRRGYIVWYGKVWYGQVCYAKVWYGIVWYGMVWYGMVRYGMGRWQGLVSSGRPAKQATPVWAPGLLVWPGLPCRALVCRALYNNVK